MRNKYCELCNGKWRMPTYKEQDSVENICKRIKKLEDRINLLVHLVEYNNKLTEKYHDYDRRNDYFNNKEENLLQLLMDIEKESNNNLKKLTSISEDFHNALAIQYQALMQRINQEIRNAQNENDKI